MKKSKELLIIFIIVLSSCGLQKAQTMQKAQVKDRIEISINSNWTEKMLKNTQTQLKLKNIDFQYSDLFINKKGELKAIKIIVNCNDGYSGSSDTKELNKNSQFGFFRDYSKSSKTQFRVGTF